MNDQQARQTPIIDLLRDIPADARMVYEVTPTHHQSIPVGVLAKNAADEIEHLRAERDEARAEREAILQAITDPENQPSQYGTVTLVMYETVAAEREAMAKDAERFRWLLDQELPDWMDVYHQHPDRVRAAIDAQIEQERSEQKEGA